MTRDELARKIQNALFEKLIGSDRLLSRADVEANVRETLRGFTPAKHFTSSVER